MVEAERYSTGVTSRVVTSQMFGRVTFGARVGWRRHVRVRQLRIARIGALNRLEIDDPASLAEHATSFAEHTR